MARSFSTCALPARVSGSTNSKACRSRRAASRAIRTAPPAPRRPAPAPARPAALPALQRAAIARPGRRKAWRALQLPPLPAETRPLHDLRPVHDRKGLRPPAQPAEIDELSAKVGTIRCMGCGAPVDIRKDHACGHCRAPIAILDPAAVEQALAASSRPKSNARRATSNCWRRHRDARTREVPPQAGQAGTGERRHHRRPST
jgi:hypothetical protein